MPKLKLTVVAALSVATLSLTLVSGAAHAVPWTFTTAGTITAGIDGLGEFGAVNHDLSGLSYTMSMTLDPDAYTRRENSEHHLHYDGNLRGQAIQIVTINGVSQRYVMDDQSVGESYLYAAPWYTQASQSIKGVMANGYELSSEQSVWSYERFFALPATEQAFAYKALASDGGFASLQIDVNGARTHFTSDVLTFVSISNLNAIPEPAPLALFTLGLCALGAARRRARG